MARKNRTRNLHEFVRLMRRFAFDLSNVILEDGCMGRSEALRRAHLASKLLRALGEGVATFEYMKKDGTLREARGTLCHGISKAFDDYEYKEDSLISECPLGMTFQYWDLDREAFRTFSADRVVRICAVSIPNYIEKGKMKNEK